MGRCRTFCHFFCQADRRVERPITIRLSVERRYGSRVWLSAKSRMSRPTSKVYPEAFSDESLAAERRTVRFVANSPPEVDERDNISRGHPVKETTKSRNNHGLSEMAGPRGPIDGCRHKTTCWRAFHQQPRAFLPRTHAENASAFASQFRLPD